MAKYYKVWVEVEYIDEENDIYEEAGDLPMSVGGHFETLKEAEKIREEIVEMFGLPPMLMGGHER